MKTLSILGSTGSIGRQALDICRNHPERYNVVALAAGQNIEALAKQIQEFHPAVVSVQSPALRDALISLLNTLGLPHPLPECVVGAEGLKQLATLPDVEDVLVGVVGFIGLAPTLEALKAGKRVLTANKETFVAGGHLVAPYLQQVVPFDSEHSALFQSLHGEPAHHVKKLWLTASGGPFREFTRLSEFEGITREQALKHPNWSMGAKVTIDSATLMNKGLELIEARWLFGLEPQQLQVLIHPQSVVHGLVEYIDGSIVTQWGPADMRVPIQVAMSWPERWSGDYMASHLDLTTLSTLEFRPPNEALFPALPLARHAMEAGSHATTVLNAADEMAVEAFLKGQLHFTEITPSVARVLEAIDEFAPSSPYPELDELMALDAWARQRFQSIKATTTK
jgi:1-deoxy-D-xylulose-5-phosphate reductoisomerase